MRDKIFELKKIPNFNKISLKFVFESTNIAIKIKISNYWVSKEAHDLHQKNYIEYDYRQKKIQIL